jgi:hypothetical protein
VSKFEEIINGWKNLVFRDPRVEKEARLRAEVCSNCSFLNKNNTCKICGCYIPAKVRSMQSKCPKKKW